MMVFIVVILLGIDGSWSDVVVETRVIVVKTSPPSPTDALNQSMNKSSHNVGAAPSHAPPDKTNLT